MINKILWNRTTLQMHIDELTQDRHNSIAHALDLRLSCTNLSINYLISCLMQLWRLWSMMLGHTSAQQNNTTAKHPFLTGYMALYEQIDWHHNHKIRPTVILKCDIISRILKASWSHFDLVTYTQASMIGIYRLVTIDVIIILTPYHSFQVTASP